MQADSLISAIRFRSGSGVAHRYGLEIRFQEIMPGMAIIERGLSPYNSICWKKDSADPEP